MDYFKINDKLVVSVISVLLAGAISFNAWAVAAMYQRPTHDEVVELIYSHSPYIEDRKHILSSLARIEEKYSELKQAINDHTSAIVELKTIISER